MRLRVGTEAKVRESHDSARLSSMPKVIAQASSSASGGDVSGLPEGEVRLSSRSIDLPLQRAPRRHGSAAPSGNRASATFRRMHDRAREYATCTRALVADLERAGASGIFDTALTNGLAAIVARRWPAEEMTAQGFVKPASALLEVIAAHAQPDDAGIYELEDIDPPPPVAVFGPPLDPTPTRIDVTLMRDAIRRTQVIRHAREEDAQPLEERHLEALTALNADAALRGSFDVEDADEHEDRVALDDAIERARARDYFDGLSIDEIERRAGVDYNNEYVETEDGERYHTPHECPVCGLEALIESTRDSYLDEYPAGTCASCSYVKRVEVADLEGRDDALQRRIDDPNA